ncbi:MAG: bifunctional hydroxymethylpyrimidine kinase/phosphomethylpyrimidine kinase, partial [Deltaproteobacteria bacterium]|nr:bifunctional hydroxymethylpyrimidine kinase/phosphomethylpyrimidine kinase [Deltaproteobacteria bacterium]
RIPTNNTHGTGCTFASAIATELAKGNNVQEAVERAKAFMETAIRFSLALGKGHGPTNPYAMIAREQARYQVLEDLEAAFETLKNHTIGHLIPEVQSNLGYALPYAEGHEDIAAFPGRITRLNNSIATVTAPAFGASRHVANIILTLMKHDPEYRSVMNIRFSEDIIHICEHVGFNVKSFDRADEPREVKEQEGSSLEWGTHEVLKTGEVPDVIYDRGEVGKEPMVRVIGKNPAEVARKVLKIKRGIG